MSIMKTNCGQPCYSISNSKISVFITVQGGHLTATFNKDKEKVDPFFIAPWWREANMFDLDEVLKLLRGNFFCSPFGINDKLYEGKKHPIHGQTCNDNWDFIEIIDANHQKEINLKMDLSNNSGKVIKSVKISNDEPIIYENNIVSGFEGKIVPGYHPTINLPEKLFSAYLDISKPITGFTLPFPGENPEKGGYSLLKSGIQINDISKVPDVYGNNINLNKCPISKGFEDYALFINDPSKDFTYTAVSFPEEGYLYFQLKNPKVFSNTFFWMSNGGRHYAPWNGRVSSVIGLEEISAFFHYGIKESIDNNFLQEYGSKTFIELQKDKSYEFKIIIGLVSIDKNFIGVENIIRKNDRYISIKGKNGKTTDVPCRVDFVQ